MARRIETEEQYQKSLDWLVSEATRLENVEEIHDPLLKPDKRDELTKNYDFVTAGVLDYQSRERSKWDPHHVYVPQVEEVPEVVMTIEPEPQAAQEIATKLSDFLDDD